MGEPLKSRIKTSVGSDKHTVRVWVTGFGLFRGNVTNPSYSIARALPELITLDALGCVVEVHCHPEPVRVAYDTVYTLTRDGIKQFRNDNDGHTPDIVIHIGMARSRNYYCLETCARREGYELVDVEGRRAAECEERFRSEGYPDTLRPGDAPCNSCTNMDPKSDGTLIPSQPNEHLLNVWQRSVPNFEDLRLSKDAGKYLCEFIYYNSLAHAWKEGRNLSVVFVHVPGWDTSKDIERGRDVIIGLIKSLIVCWSPQGSSPMPH
ncbi:hypothetical protein KEM54_003326 [Ascosphaera aggregata]|nr:hypothetical protein KEM54_003326 [Ascosphaera aggregata]